MPYPKLTYRSCSKVSLLELHKTIYCSVCGREVRPRDLIPVEQKLPGIMVVSPCCDAEATEVGLGAFKCGHCGKITYGRINLHFKYDWDHPIFDYPLRTPCCKADTIDSFLVPVDYEPRLLRGEKYSTPSLPAMIQLCNRIGKSPHTIRHDREGFYIEVRSKAFLKKLAEEFGLKLPPEEEGEK